MTDDILRQILSVRNVVRNTYGENSNVTLKKQWYKWSDGPCDRYQTKYNAILVEGYCGAGFSKLITPIGGDIYIDGVSSYKCDGSMVKTEASIMKQLGLVLIEKKYRSSYSGNIYGPWYVVTKIGEQTLNVPILDSFNAYLKEENEDKLSYTECKQVFAPIRFPTD